MPYMDMEYLEGVREAQRKWAEVPLRERLRLIARLRRNMACGSQELAETVPRALAGALHRTVADSMAAEVLPLAEACRFLEAEAERILRRKVLGSKGRPLWLGSVAVEVERAPWGVVLVLAAGNYPLFLAGVQVLQALVAGNAVLWKPAPGTETVAYALRMLLLEAGLGLGLLTVLDSSVEAGTRAIAAGVDYVVLTGSAETGKRVLRQLAETLTPATMELSGCDAVFVLPGADMGRAIAALAFGLRFNGSFTCMAPRRVFLVGLSEAQASEFETGLSAAVMGFDPVALAKESFGLLRELMDDALGQGAKVLLSGLPEDEESNAGFRAKVTLIAGATPAMRVMRTEIFAPILSVMRTADVEEALNANAACPYALSASIFSPEREGRKLARRLRVGNVLINDVIAPTADPRTDFGGRGRSGFGVTRGADGLLGMTTPRTLHVQRSRTKLSYEPTGEGHIALFAGLTELLHGGGIRVKWSGLKRMIAAARKLKY
jgi:aldehyde dehydrogenase (NAD+)